MAENFFRTFVDDRSFIRGAARLLIAPITQAFPTKIEDVIALAPVTGTADVQTLTGTATSGNIKLTVGGQQTGSISATSSAAQVQAALEALSTVGAGNVVCTGGALDTNPVVATFAASLGNPGAISVDNTGAVGGTVTVVHTTTGVTSRALYDALTGWTDLGATKTGIQITINNAEETFDIDQQLGIIGSQPTTWECSVGTALAESTPERMQIAWQGSAITVDTTPTSGSEKEIGFGSPNFYTQRRMSVLFQRPSGKIRAYFFRIVQRTPQESSIAHAKTGEQQSIPVRFNVLADNTVTDVLKQFFIIRDQAVS